MKQFALLGIVLASCTCCVGYRLPEITIANELNLTEQSTFLGLVNNKRQNAQSSNVNCSDGGANFPAKNFNTNSQALTLDNSLTKAALAHINHMARTHPNGFTVSGNPNALAFDPHNKAGDGTPVDRANAAGFLGSGWGEVMAFDFATSSEVLNKWLTSSFGHCQVVMDNDFNRAGIAKVTVPNSSKTYWIMAVGRNP
jgi:uncharacterized protein YkwD